MPAHNVIANINKAKDISADFKTTGIKSDVLAEKTAGSGVTADSVNLKDGKVTAAGDTAAGDNASMGYTAAEGLILTGQGTTSDITMKNDADAAVLTVATGQTAIARVGGDKTLMIAIADGAAYTVLAANSGKVHIIANQAQDVTLTLPSAAAGLYFEFWHGMEAADGHDWIFDTGADANYFKGGLLFCDSDVGGAASEVITIAGDGDSNSKLTVNIPSTGTFVKMYCDGTNWFLNGTVLSATIPAFADQ